MNAIISFLNQSGDAALHFAGAMAWQAALVIAVVFGLDIVIRNRSRAALRYALWLLVLVKLLLPPSVALPTGIGYWIRASEPPVPVVLAPDPKAQVSSEPVEFPLPSVVEPLPAPAATLHDAGILLALWTAGVVVLLVLLAARSGRLRRVVAEAQPAPDSIQVLVQAAAGQVKLTKPVPVRMSDNIGSPAVCGLWKPVILLPADLSARLSGDHLRSVLLHELLHVKRRDVWVNCLQTLLQAVYWWHPLVWFANEHIRRTREEVVDEGVMVALGESSEVYPSTLLEVAKGALRRPLTALGLVGIFESRSALRQRIQRLIDKPVPQSARLSAFGWGAVLTTGVLMLPMAQGKPADSAVGVTSGKPQMASNEQVFLDCYLLSAASEAIDRLDLGRPHLNLTNSQRVWIYNEVGKSNLTRSIGIQPNIRVVARPRMQTSSGTACSVAIVQTTNVNGKSVTLGPVCEAMPAINGTNIEVSLKLRMGMLDPAAPDGYIDQVLADLHVNVPDQGAALVINSDLRAPDRDVLALLVQPTSLGWQAGVPSPGRATPGLSGEFVREPGVYPLDEEGSRLEIGSDSDGGVTLKGIWHAPTRGAAIAPSGALQPGKWFVYIEAPNRLWAYYGNGSGALYSQSEDAGGIFGFEAGVLADAPNAFVDALPEQVQADYNLKGSAGSDAVPDGDKLVTRSYRLNLGSARHNLPKQIGSVDFSIGEALRRYLAESGVAADPSTNFDVLESQALSTPRDDVIVSESQNFRATVSEVMLTVRATLEDHSRIWSALEALNRVPTQLLIETRFIEVPRRLEHTIDVGTPLPLKNATGRVRMLDEAQTLSLLRTLEATPGVDVMALPRVTTLSHRETQIQAVDIRSVVAAINTSGGKPELVTEPMALGPTLNVIPKANQEDGTFELVAVLQVREFLGYAADGQPSGLTPPGREIHLKTEIDDTAPDYTQAIWRDRRMTAKATIYDHYTLMLTKPQVSVSAKRLSTGDVSTVALPGEEQGLLVLLITPTMIDPAGNFLSAPKPHSGIPTQLD